MESMYPPLMAAFLRATDIYVYVALARGWGGVVLMLWMSTEARAILKRVTIHPSIQ